MSPRNEAESPARPAEPSARGAVKILVVDDEPGIRQMLAYELSSLGYAVSTAADGEQAVEKARRERFNLMICDMKMPRRDGLETLETVKRLDPDVEVIMATGYGSVESAVGAMKRGAYDFIQKPFHLEELFALIEKALEKREMRAALGVYEASKAVFSSVKLDTLLPAIARLAVRLLGADDVSVMLYDDAGRLMVAASAGVRGGPPPDGRIHLGERVAERAIREREPLLISGPLEADARFSDIPSLRDIRHSLVYPLMIEGEALGVMNVNRTVREEPFGAVDVRHATVFSAQIAQAVCNAKLYRRLEDRLAELKAANAELEKTQRQLVQSEKLAAVGQLAAGVAHELNNPLTGILGFSQLLLQETNLTPQQREDLESIYKQSQRCRTIIQNLLQFSRRQEPRKEDTPVSSLLDATAQFVAYDLTTSGVEFIKDYPADLPAVHVDPNQLQQVFLNLLTNARHALEGRKGGRVTLGARAVEGRLRVWVEDTGCGVPAANLGKVFEPFFTTKPVGKGTGLGLSISYGIVQEHEGTLTVESREGAGSRFTVDLPVQKS